MTVDQIKINIGIVPGRMEEGVIANVGTTVVDALYAANFTPEQQKKYRVRVDHKVASFDTKLLTNCTVVLTLNSINGKGFELRPPERILVYYNGRRGIKKRRNEMEVFLHKMNVGNSEIITVLELDVKGRDGFQQHMAFLDHDDAALIVYDLQDIDHNVVRPQALKVPTFVVSMFEGSPTAAGSQDAYDHDQWVKEMLSGSDKTEQKKRVLSPQNIDDKSAAHQQDLRLLEYIEDILSKPTQYNGQWAVDNNDLKDELLKQYNYDISISLLDKKVGRLNKEIGGVRSSINAMKENNKKRNKALLNPAH